MRDALQMAVNASVEAARKRGEEERDRLLAEAKETAAKAMEEVEQKSRVVEEERAKLEEEKKAMSKAHGFQKTKVLLNVGGHRFETSRQTLTSVPDTYLSSMFSGRFELTPDDDNAYFIDRDGRHFHHVINFLREPFSFKLSKDMTETQKEELKIELKFYGLLDCMMPYHAQEHIGRSLLRSACHTGSKGALKTAVAQARVLVFEMGSDKVPFLSEKFQDSRFVITDRVVNGSPVWAMEDDVEGDEVFMYRANSQKMNISVASDCVEGSNRGFMYNATGTPEVVAPTELPSGSWISSLVSTLDSQYASAERTAPDSPWVRVPSIHITAVHGLDDGDPAMVAACRQLAALS